MIFHLIHFHCRKVKTKTIKYKYKTTAMLELNGVNIKIGKHTLHKTLKKTTST